jgi:hypothetical protein
VRKVVLLAVGVIALLIITGVLLAVRDLTGAGDTYHVSVGAPPPGTRAHPNKTEPSKSLSTAVP